jgi:hypothetical protein
MPPTFPSHLSFILFSLFFCFCGTGVWTLGFAFAKQMLYHLSHLQFSFKLSMVMQSHLLSSVGYVHEFKEHQQSLLPDPSVLSCLLFTIAKLWEQPRCLTTDEWIKKMYLYTMEFYAAMKKNEMLSFAGKWMELENIIVSEVSLAQKTKNRMFSLICGH